MDTQRQLRAIFSRSVLPLCGVRTISAMLQCMVPYTLYGTVWYHIGFRRAIIYHGVLKEVIEHSILSPLHLGSDTSNLHPPGKQSRQHWKQSWPAPRNACPLKKSDRQFSKFITNRRKFSQRKRLWRWRVRPAWMRIRECSFVVFALRLSVAILMYLLFRSS